MRLQCTGPYQRFSLQAGCRRPLLACVADRDRPMSEQGIVKAIEVFDTSAFVVESQTSAEDKVSFLRIQNLIRACAANYVYMEVGSHLGGTLVPHLADPRCRSVISIDPRPHKQPDERGCSFTYDGNSTARMIEGLKQVLSIDCLAKLRTFDLDAAQVPLVDIAARADLVMVDGEHTNVAVFSDVMSLLPAIVPDAIIAFHDANLVADAIQNLERYFIYAGIEFATVFLRDSVCAIGLRGMAERVTVALAPYARYREQFLADARSAAAREELASRLRAIESSTIWRATGPLRRLVSSMLGRQ
jgi:hypothetical protein